MLCLAFLLAIALRVCCARETFSRMDSAVAVTTGRVHTQLHSRHRSVEFKKFLNHLDREAPDDLEVGGPEVSGQWEPLPSPV